MSAMKTAFSQYNLTSLSSQVSGRRGVGLEGETFIWLNFRPDLGQGTNGNCCVFLFLNEVLIILVAAAAGGPSNSSKSMSMAETPY